MVKVKLVNGEARIWNYDDLTLEPITLSLYTTHTVIVENLVIFFVFFI